LGGSLLGRVRKRRLVPVMTVGDQELPASEEFSHTVFRGEAPQPRPLDVEIRLASGRRNRRLAVVEEKDRLDLRPRGTEQTQPALLRPHVRALMGQDDTCLVRLDTQRGDEPLPCACHAVRPDVVLSERPHRGFAVANEGAVGEPRPEELAGLLLGVVQRQVDDVVRVARGKHVPLGRGDDVVGRGDDRLSRMRVAHGAELRDVGHPTSLDSTAMTTIAELEEDRTVEGVYAVARKDKKRTRNGSPYLALELVDA